MSFCFSFVNAIECDKALGMENGLIADGQITASSHLNGSHEPFLARLRLRPVPLGRIGAWASLYNDLNQWLQVDLGLQYNVSRIATQGREDIGQWVTKYKLQFSEDGVMFYNYTDELGQIKVNTLSFHR